MTAPCIDTLDDPGWGQVCWRASEPSIAYRRLAEEMFLALHAQAQRCEAVALGYGEETARFFGLGEHAGGGVEQLLTEHGTASTYKGCTAGELGGRCELCRAWQRARVARNRRARAGRCTRSRSSYDAGCRCRSCTSANTAGCRSWRERSR